MLSLCLLGVIAQRLKIPLRHCLTESIASGLKNHPTLPSPYPILIQIEADQDVMPAPWTTGESVEDSESVGGNEIGCPLVFFFNPSM